jgi:hypothetical protein
MSSSTSGSKIKKYLAGFFLLMLFTFLFDRGLFLLLSNLEAHFYKPENFEDRFARFVKDKHYNTLILGTSRAYDGIHPYYIAKFLGQKAFRETFQGKGPKYNYYFYHVYKKYAGIPKVVIYGVDYFIYAVESDPKWMARFNLEKKNKNEDVNFFSSPLLLLQYKKKIDNFHNNVLIHFQEKSPPKKNEDSFKDFIEIQEYRGVKAPNKKMIIKRPAKFRRQFFIRYPGQEGRYFKKLLDELEKDKVTIILVALPDFIGTYKTNFQREEFIFHLKTLKRDYKNCYVYNYNRPRVFDINNVDYFNDGGWGNTNSHLSKLGGIVFNKILCEDLRKHYQ